MSEGVTPISEAQANALPQIEKAAGASPTPEKPHKDGILSRLRHILGKESGMKGPGTGNDKLPSNPNLVSGTPENAKFTTGLDNIAANARAEEEKPAHAGYGSDAQAARRADVMNSGLNVATTAPESAAVSPLTPVAEALNTASTAAEDKSSDHDFSTTEGIEKAMANITDSLAVQSGEDRHGGVASKIAGVGAAGLVGVGALGGGVAAAETPTQDAPPAVEQAGEMPSSTSVVEADGQSATVNVDADNPQNSVITVTPTEGTVTQEITASSTEESLTATDAAGAPIEESTLAAAESGTMREAIFIMKERADLRDQLVVVKDADGNVGLYTKDGRSVTKNDAGEVVVADNPSASFDGSQLVATMGWSKRTTDTVETTSYPPEGTVGEIETATPEKYQGGMFEITMPGGEKVETCAVDNPSMIAESVSYTFKDKDGNVLNTYGSLADAQSSDYVAGGTVEQSIVPKAGCEKLAENSMIAVHNQGEKQGFDPAVEQPLLTSGGVAEVTQDENGVAHYVSKVVLPELGLPGENGEAICSTYVQLDGIIGKALESVGYEGGFYSFQQNYEDVRLISAGDDQLALVCTPKEIPPTVSVDEHEKTDKLSVPMIILIKAPVTPPPTPPEETPPVVEEPKLPNTGGPIADLAKVGGGLTGAGAGMAEIARRLKRGGDGGGEGDSTSGSMMRPNGETYPAAFENSKFAKGVGENDKVNLEKAYYTWMRKDGEGRSYAKAQLAAKLAEVTDLTNALTATDEEDSDVAQAA